MSTPRPEIECPVITSHVPAPGGANDSTSSMMGTAIKLAMVEAAETTRIPVDARAGHYGAIAYFAVLCYPGIDPRSHQLRNQFTTGLLEYFRGIIKYRAGFKRITRARVGSSENTWLRQPRSMKNEQVFATCNRAENIIREQRRALSLCISRNGDLARGRYEHGSHRAPSGGRRRLLR